MPERFHRAARDGYLEILKEATKRDCNHQDEDGLTPTHHAAFEGNLTSLRLIVSRGGDPNKTDNYGNTALHCASAKGHMECVTYLVNFGTNIWVLDNDAHTAKDLAAMNDKEDTLRYLDTEAAKQDKLDPKKAKKLQEKAKKDSEKKKKEFDKIQERASMKREEEQLKYKQKMEEQRKQQLKEGQLKNLKKLEDINNIENKNPDTKKSFIGTISKTSQALISAIPKPASNAESNAQNRATFSVLSQNAQNKKSIKGLQKKIIKKKLQDDKSSGFQVSEIDEGGKRTLRILSGVIGESEVGFIQNESFSSGGSDSPTAGKRGKLSDVYDIEIPQEPRYVPGLLQQHDSIFGFKKLAFRQTMTPTLSALQSKLNESNSSDDDGFVQDESAPFESQDLPSDDESVPSPIYVFLVSVGLQNYIPFFNEEDIDLDALMLLTEEDLKALKLPMGPRRKLLNAIAERKASIENPGEVVDIRL